MQERIRRVDHEPRDGTAVIGPTGAVEHPYRSSPIFTAATLPKALQHQHSTKKGVWAVIRVLEGSLRYCMEDGSPPLTVTTDRPGIIRPEEPHHVELVGPVSVRIDFFDHELTEESTWTC